MVNSSGGSGLRRPSGLFSFIREVFSELRKTAWPTREHTLRLAFFVVIIGLIIGVFLGLVDMGFTQIFNRFIL